MKYYLGKLVKLKSAFSHFLKLSSVTPIKRNYLLPLLFDLMEKTMFQGLSNNLFLNANFIIQQLTVKHATIFKFT